MRSSAIASVLSVLVHAPLLAQTFWYVDEDGCPAPGSGTYGDPFCSIQDGINAAMNGDTVLVRPGAYVENLDFMGKAILLRSDADGDSATYDTDPKNTVIDGDQSGSVVKFVSMESRSSILEGFTLTNGSGTLDPWSGQSGGGVYCLDSSPTIRGNNIIDNSFDGGGAYPRGGGIACWSASSPLIDHNVIANNDIGTSYGHDGGGIYYRGIGEETAPEILHNHISGNSSYWAGGIYCNASAGAPPVVVGNMIVGNFASDAGGGIVCNRDAVLVIDNNLILSNQGNRGGGIFCFFDSAPFITNSILWDNSDDEIQMEATASPVVAFSVVRGGFPGQGNIDADPRLVDPNGPDNNLATWYDNDYHLNALSPCIDAGDNTTPGLPAEDFEGDPRRVDVASIPDTGNGTAPIVDMGGDEFARHCYALGSSVPGGYIEVKFTAPPGTPGWFWIAVDVLDVPLETKLGDWYLLPPVVFSVLPVTPASGVNVLGWSIPTTPPGPYSVHLQGIFANPTALTNLCTVAVE